MVRKTGVFWLLLWFLVARQQAFSALQAGETQGGSGVSARAPSIILILADDLGYGEIGRAHV